MIKCVDGKKIDSKDFYIKWPDPIKVSKEAARITRFDMKKYMLRAIPYDEIFPTMDDWLSNSDYIAGHNILGFDIYLIKEYYATMGKEYKHLLPKVIDTMCLARGVKSGNYYKQGEDLLTYQYKMLHTRTKGMRTNLISLGKEYEIKHDYSRLHDAIVDLELNLKVWNKIKWMVEL
jgi:DNA polymerase III epsilon subunit-like protein